MNPLRIFRVIGYFITAPISTPRGLVAHGVFFALMFAGLHLAGWREYTSFVSGTSAVGDSLTVGYVLKGGLYLLFFLCTVVLTPIYLIAAGLLAWFRRLGRFWKDALTSGDHRPRSRQACAASSDRL